MPGASDPRLQTLLNADFGSGTPATWYLAALLTMPGADGTGYAEPSGGAYGRIALTNNGTNFPAATTVGGVTAQVNGVAWSHPNPTGNWGLVIGWGMFTVSTVGSGVCQYSNLLDGQGYNVKSGLSPVQYDIGQWIMSNARPS